MRKGRAWLCPFSWESPSYTERLRFDALERPTSRTLVNATRRGEESSTQGVAYDKRGQKISETDAYGKARYYAYDALGQLVEATDALGGKTRARYDARGNLVELTDAMGSTHRFEYDRNDRVVAEIFPLGQKILTAYDAAGRPSERTDPKGQRTLYRHDAAGRLVETKLLAADGSLLRTTTSTWDAADNRSAWSDTDHVRNQTTSGTATFDDANRKTGETITYPGGYQL
ncbi:MAG: hypothetical protein RR412_11475, partial [Burkholderiaceae bacterium]